MRVNCRGPYTPEKAVSLGSRNVRLINNGVTKSEKEKRRVRKSNGFVVGP